MSKQPSLYALPNIAVLQQNLYQYIVQAQQAAFARHQRFKIAVSGGSLPSILASEQLLTSPVLQFDKWEIFFADERAVPLDHPDSNYGLFKSTFIDKLPAGTPQPTVFPIDESQLSSTQELADAYEKSLINSFAAKDSVKLPIFDLLLLGCGPDGHTCSLFPGHPLLREEEAWVAEIQDSPKPPPCRITLTLPIITHALRIAFVSTGSGKKEVMKQIFDVQAEEGRLPCALVNDAAGDRVTWFCDESAVEGVAYARKAPIVI